MRDPLARPELLIRRVYAYVAYRLGDGPEAEDITSATFERALRYRTSFDARRGEPVAWLIGIARRCIADAAQGDVPLPVADEATEGHEDAVVLRLELRRGLARLTGRERELLSLRYGADLTARQIAQLLDMNTNAVEVALHRALASLRLVMDTRSEASTGASELGWLPQSRT